MGLRVAGTAYGRPASEQLHAVVARAKEGEPLAPVSVIVPTNSVGVAARRLLASGALGPLTPAGKGVVGVNFLTVLRLSELLGMPRLAVAGRRPVSTPVVAAAVREVLGRAPGVFRPVAAHPATEEALVAAHRELSDLDDTQLDVLASQYRRAHEVVRVHRAVRRALSASWYDERDLMDAAVAAIAEGSPPLRDIGTVVCFLPQRWSAPEARVLRTLADRCDVDVIAGLTGSVRADTAVHASIGRIGGKVDEETVASITPPTGSEVVDASDADDEVRAIVRDVVDAMRAGVPLERMAILYGVADPYARLVHEHLDLAGIAHNGVSVRTLADSVLGRSVVRLLALGDDGFSRDDVCALMSAAPVLDGHGRPVRATEWERVSRKAGVIAGRDEWRARLDAYAAQQGDDDRGRRERARAEELRAFVDVLVSAVDEVRNVTTWAGFATWAHRLIRRFVGDERRRERWPEIEQEAARRVEAAIDRLAGLDSVDSRPTLDVFRRTFQLELDGARDRVGRIGDGILAGPVALALGVDLERVWVCGLAEGVFPSVPRDDPLLGDAARAALDGELPLRAERVDDDERALLAALASTGGARVCTWPRGDLRRSAERVPSRFLQGTLGVVRADHTRSVPSYAHGVSAALFPASRHDLAVRAAVTRDGWVEAIPAVARGRATLDARASAAFTRFDGNLAELGPRLRAISPLGGDRAVSPTGLELWASCPHAYFVQYVLGAEPVERPEEIMQISPLDRGTIVHEVLDDFLARGPRERERLLALAEAACDAAEGRGITGRRLLWERDRRMIIAELDAFFDADARWRFEQHAHTVATELAFGMPGAAQPPVELVWDDGRALRVRGKADRIDVRNDRTIIVIDYKTGSAEWYKNLTHDDPVHEGRRLQLPIYAHAARRAFGDDRSAVEAYYWFVGRGEDKRVGYAVDEAVDATFHDTVRTIVDNIEAGVFVAHPSAPGPKPFVDCHYCDPDGTGTAERWHEWERKQAAPALAGYRSLFEHEAEES